LGKGDLIRVAIYGASGYAGFELYKILKRHRNVELRYITAEASAGKMVSDLFPIVDNRPLVRNEDVKLSEVDAVFLSLPHGAAKKVVEQIKEQDHRVRIIDLSADFRFDNALEYEKWYGEKHTSPQLLSDFVYGLTEIYRHALSKAQFVANPGCYPTASILGLYPLLKRNLVDFSQPVIIDAKSGVSGGGRKPEIRLLFVEANENVSPYSIGYVHRHTGEIEQELSKIAGRNINVVFSPHLVPVSRGMLNTMYVRLNEDLTSEELTAIFEETYQFEFFVRVLPRKSIATMQHSTGTNLAVISVKRVENSPYAIVVSSIDNLIKGAAGQAVQNFNVMFQIDEKESLI
jgi:N-acetyl-gamma-glutamyl-phosphate reductase